MEIGNNFDLYISIKRTSVSNANINKFPMSIVFSNRQRVIYVRVIQQNFFLQFAM